VCPNLQAHSRRRDVSDLKDERPGVGLPTPNPGGAGWDLLHDTPDAPRRIWGIPLYCWGKYGCRLIECYGWGGDSAGLVGAIPGNCGAEPPRRATDIPEMEYWANDAARSALSGPTESSEKQGSTLCSTSGQGSLPQFRAQCCQSGISAGGKGLPRWGSLPWRDERPRVGMNSLSECRWLRTARPLGSVGRSRKQSWKRCDSTKTASERGLRGQEAE
jgi:hypothetical protein